MNIKKILLVTCLFMAVTAQAQNSRFSIQGLYGLTGNFFVRQYDETTGPANKTYFYSKDFIGAIGGLELHYQLSKRSSIGIGYARSTNKGRKNYAGVVGGTDLYIEDFTLRHIDNFYELQYHYRLGKKADAGWRLETGLFLLYDVKQTINIENYDNLILMQENNYKNSNSVEGGILLGFSYAKKIDTHFDLGIKAKAYYLLSTSSMEAITLTPTLTYRF